MKIPGGKMRVISNSGEPFSGRMEAGRLLAQELAEYKGKNTVVLGIPRGGMMIAGVIARELGSELDIVISRKLRAPMNPELAIGAVTESGKVFLDDRFADEMSWQAAYVSDEKAFQLGEIRRRVKLFRAVKPKITLEGRTVIITDDGLATGSTMRAAVWSARQEHPDKIIAALPVAPEDSLWKIAGMADETVCLKVPPEFFGVGQFYRDFSQIEDIEVIEILKNSAKKSEREPAGATEKQVLKAMKGRVLGAAELMGKYGR